MSKVQIVDECWVFTGRRNNGYGTIKVYPQTRYTHIVMYEDKFGVVPSGLQLDHLCRNKACCNPDHLEPVTALVNTQRARK